MMAFTHKRNRSLGNLLYYDGNPEQVFDINRRTTRNIVYIQKKRSGVWCKDKWRICLAATTEVSWDRMDKLQYIFRVPPTHAQWDSADMLNSMKSSPPVLYVLLVMIRNMSQTAVLYGNDNRSPESFVQ